MTILTTEELAAWLRYSTEKIAVMARRGDFTEGRHYQKRRRPRDEYRWVKEAIEEDWFPKVVVPQPPQPEPEPEPPTPEMCRFEPVYRNRRRA